MKELRGMETGRTSMEDRSDQEVSGKGVGTQVPRLGGIGPNGTGQKDQSGHIYSEHDELLVTLEKLVTSLEGRNESRRCEGWWGEFLE
jgi:hypothetical protein